MNQRFKNRVSLAENLERSVILQRDDGGQVSRMNAETSSSLTPGVFLFKENNTVTTTGTNLLQRGEEAKKQLPFHQACSFAAA